jgi:putative heme-binding domain-containing protein
LKSWLAADEAEEKEKKDAAAHPHPADLRQQWLAFARDPAVQAVMAEALARRSTPVARRVHLLEVMAAAPFGADAWPDCWVEALKTALKDRDERVVRQAVSVLRATGRTGFQAPLVALAGDRSRSDDLRVEALEAAAARLPRVDGATFDFLVARLGRDEPPLRRMAAARALGRAPLDEGQLLALTRAVAAAGAIVLPSLLPAFERSSDPGVGSALLTALGESPGLRSLTPSDLQRALRVYPDEIRRQAGPLLGRLQVSYQEQEKASRLAGLEPILGQGDPRRGREVFFGPRATCSTCHTIGPEGGHVGPDLSRIGASRSGRDLLEAIVFPSASFARGYEPVTVATSDGRVHSGIIARESSEAIVLVSPDRLERTLPHSSIEEIEPAQLSIMPRGLDANLSRQELADLVAFLRSRD